ncbi:MAG: polysaccharide deacetylase family protein [Deltaproteobacteria bacterium]|nr:polysaccharide deacetylase family protein [Deltaproteobacteria bacterium]
MLVIVFLLCLSPESAFPGTKTTLTNPSVGVPILLYHRFDTRANDAMTVTTAVFESQLAYLRKNGFRVIPLRRLVDWHLGKAPAPPAKSLVLVADDGHKSIYRHMLPIIRKYNVPVTLFIYPSAVSNAEYAMTWDQLRELRKTGLFDIQSHSYWHPNFRKERNTLPQAQYLKFVDIQLRKSKAKLEKEVGGQVDMIAWPFGELPDQELVNKAKTAGYAAAFTIVRRAVTPQESTMMLPRFLILNSDKGKAFEALVQTYNNGAQSR